MSHEAYEDVFTQLNESSGPALAVYVYANTNNELDYIKQNGDNDYIMDAWESTLKNYFGGGSIGLISLNRYKHEANGGNYPNVNGDSYHDYNGSFDSWMSDEDANGYGDLTQYSGAHLFIHGNGCSVEHASASDGGDDSDYNSFNVSIQAWSGISSCESENFEIASAIQEPLHTYINYKNDVVQDLLNNTSDHMDEHALGQIDNGKVTPLLTYHSDEGYAEKGECDKNSNPDSWTAELTTCTVDAVHATADEA